MRLKQPNRLINLSIALFLVGQTGLSSAVNLTIGSGVALDDSLQQLKQKLSTNCKSIKVIDIKKTTYPLAESQEQHLLCNQYSSGEFKFEEAVFVLADNQFTQMEARGITVEPVAQALGKPMGNYLNMDVFEEGRYWLDKNRSRLKWIRKDAVHPNLFAWENGYLHPEVKTPVSFSTKIPSLLDFDSELSKMRRVFKQQCKQIKEDKIENISLKNKPKEQIQINCFGYSYAGFDRKFEAVFGDGKLQVIWVLTAKPEEQRLRELLIADWGKATLVNEVWEVFDGGKIALRKDKPELLILSDEMIPHYQEWFNKGQ